MKKTLISERTRHFWGKLFLTSLCFYIISLCNSVPVFSETTDKKTTPKSQSFISNDELLKQAMTIFNDASGRFLAHLREVSKAETLLDQARQKTESSEMPGEKPAPPSEDKSPAETARIDSDHAKARVDAFKNRLKLTLAEKTLLEKHIKHIETAQLSAQKFADAIEGLNLFLLEISLRVDDGTLSRNEVPDSLNEPNLLTKKKEVTVTQDDLKQKEKAAAGNIETAVSHSEEAKTAVIEAEAAYASAKGRYSMVLKRQELEKEYSGYAPEWMLKQISELQHERLWLKATFYQSQTRFAASRSDALGIQQEIESFSPPEKAGGMQQEDVQQAAKIVEELDAYHTERIKKFSRLRSALQSFMKLGQSFGGDVTVLNEHISKMQMIANILERFASEGKIKPDSIPVQARAQALRAAGSTASEFISEALAAVGKTKDQLAGIDGEIEKSEVAKKDARERLAALEKNRKVAQEAREWEETISHLPAQEIAEKFRESRKKSREVMATLKEEEKAYEKALADIDEITHKLESLRDPLLRSAQNENLEEKENIFKSLYKFAKLELPDKKTVTAQDVEKPGDVPDAPVKDATKKTDDKPSDKKTDKPGIISGESTEKYQNLLSTRVRIIDEQQEHRKELIKAVNAMDQTLEKYVAALMEARKTAMHLNANALEIKKRLGKGELDSSEIPEGITEALKREPITELETKLGVFLNNHTVIRQQIDSLGRKDDTGKKIRTLLADIQNLTGTRLDIFGNLQKLEQSFERKQEAISETELRSLEQKAARLLVSEDTKSDFFLGFAQSADAKSLTELLKAYYLEIVELEIKQENLKRQKNRAERLIEIAENEKAVISKALPLFKEQIGYLETVKEEEQVKIRGRLMPQKTEALLKSFEAKTGRTIPPPPPVDDRYKPSVIKKATAIIFDKHIRIAAAVKWISLFEQRLSSSGINAEIGIYQEKAGVIDAESLATGRRIRQISGHSLEQVAKMTPEEKAGVEINSLRFLEGELGVLRADRHKILTQKAIWTSAKTGVIFLLALVLTWLVNFLSNRIVKKSGDKGETDPHALILLTLLRGSFKFAIWVIALVAILDSVGFNVGTILAGFGIGGFAIAIASKETLSNVIGGINILIFKPFKVKDWISFQNKFFKVTDISLCYTKLLNYNSNSPTLVPNALITSDAIMCYPLNQPWRMEENIQLSKRNSAEKLSSAVDLMPKAFETGAYVKDIELKQMRFTKIEEYSFSFRLIYEINLNGINLAAARTAIHEEIVRLYQENGIEFADHPLKMIEKGG